MPKEIDRIKEKFISKTIEQRKNLEIVWRIFKLIHMEEPACFLDMNSDTINWIHEEKSVEIINSGREKYKVSVILVLMGDGNKLSPLV